jgi:polysaccharide export outer membrane protein
MVISRVPRLTGVFMRNLAFLLLLPLLTGCLPASGPRTAAIVTDAHVVDAPFAVIALDQPVAELLASRQAASFADTFGMGSSAPTLTLGVGDQVVVTIFEAAPGGLFSGDPSTVGASKSVSLPPQPVSREGTLSVPYVGQVRAAGLTPVQVQRAVEVALKDKAIEPQVIVTVMTSTSTFVTVAGDVARTGQFPLNLGGFRLLDAIATAGGSKDADYNTFVRLTRGGSSATVSLARVVRDPRQNIYLRPNDLVYVYSDPQVYTSFGATLRNTTIPFTSDRLTLAEAVGAAGGLNDLRADARGVFVFRYEDPDVYAAVRSIQPQALGSPAPTTAGVPVIYKLNMQDPIGFFSAQRFVMRDNDVLYVSNSTSVDFAKLLSVFTGGLSSANSASSLTTRFTVP